jgi:hypothetical protein
MSDNWEVKKVEKSGDGFWVNIVPTAPSGGDGMAHIFNVLILSFSFMHLFGVVGGWWWLFWATIALVLSAFFHMACLIISFIILGFFLFT